VWGNSLAFYVAEGEQHGCAYGFVRPESEEQRQSGAKGGN
jgi:hypothetical protein